MDIFNLSLCSGFPTSPTQSGNWSPQRLHNRARTTLQKQLRLVLLLRRTTSKTFIPGFYHRGHVSLQFLCCCNSYYKKFQTSRNRFSKVKTASCFLQCTAGACQMTLAWPVHFTQTWPAKLERTVPALIKTYQSSDKSWWFLRIAASVIVLSAVCCSQQAG